MQFVKESWQANWQFYLAHKLEELVLFQRNSNEWIWQIKRVIARCCLFLSVCYGLHRPGWPKWSEWLIDWLIMKIKALSRCGWCQSLHQSLDGTNNPATVGTLCRLSAWRVAAMQTWLKWLKSRSVDNLHRTIRHVPGGAISFLGNNASAVCDRPT